MIKACLFDLGNVLIRFSHERMYRQMGEIAGLAPEVIVSALESERLQWRYEAGHVTSNELLAALRKIAKRTFSDQAMLEAASDIFEAIQEMPAVLAALKAKGQRLVIVSNTNEAHMAFAKARFDCFRYFDELIFSYKVRAMKPEAAFYQAAWKAAECAREECLFIDDLLVNVEGARSFGFRGVVFESVEGLLRDLEAHDVMPRPR